MQASDLKEMLQRIEGPRSDAEHGNAELDNAELENAELENTELGNAELEDAELYDLVSKICRVQETDPKEMLNRVEGPRSDAELENPGL